MRQTRKQAIFAAGLATIRHVAAASNAVSLRQAVMGTSVFDEFAKLMTDAAGVAQGARREVETALKSQGERLLSQMDLVQRDEFEAVKEMASKARLACAGTTSKTACAASMPS